MAEKRYKSFVVIGDDEAKTTRVFFYIGSGSKRSADFMRENALDYYEERFPQTWFPEISNEKNFNNKNPHEFNNLVQAAVAEGRAEHSKIPKLGDRWIVTPKIEDMPKPEETLDEIIGIEDVSHDANVEQVQTVAVDIRERESASITVEGFRQIEDDRVGLPDDGDDYEEEDEARIFSPVTTFNPELIDISQLDGRDGGDVITDCDPGDEDDERDTAELPIPLPLERTSIADQDYPSVQAIGGYSVENEGKAAVENIRKDQKPLDDDELPTPEEMEEEAKRLREIPLPPRKNTGDLVASGIPTTPPTNVQEGHRRSCPIH